MKATFLCVLFFVSCAFSQAQKPCDPKESSELVFEFPKGKQAVPFLVTVESLANQVNLVPGSDHKQWFETWIPRLLAVEVDDLGGHVLGGSRVKSLKIFRDNCTGFPDVRVNNAKPVTAGEKSKWKYAVAGLLNFGLPVALTSLGVSPWVIMPTSMASGFFTERMMTSSHAQIYRGEGIEVADRQKNRKRNKYDDFEEAFMNHH